MLKSDIDPLLNSIFSNINPEIYHYQRGTHPGINFYIKTILPGPKILNDETWQLWKSWIHLQETYPSLIKLVDTSINWSGELLYGWWTIWLDISIDIIWKYNSYTGLEYEIIDYDKGLKLSADISLEWLDNLANRQLQNDKVCYEKLEEISEYLKKYTSDTTANKLRADLKIIENDDIHTKTINRDQLDT